MRTPVESQDLDVSLLRTFLAVAQHGSMGKTAAAVDRTQPAISARIMRLERIVGQKLFARRRSGAKLTRHGELLVTYANRAVSLSEEALGQLRGAAANQRLSLGMSPDFALVGFAATMKRFRALHPGLELKVIVTDGNRVDALLNAGKLDLAVAQPDSMTQAPSVTWWTALEWAVSFELRIDSSRTLPLVLFEPPCPWQDEMLNSLQAAGWKWRVTFESTSLDAILAAVQSGLGMAVLCGELIRARGLSSVENLQLPPAPRIQFGLFHADAVPSEAASALERALDSMFRS